MFNCDNYSSFLATSLVSCILFSTVPYDNPVSYTHLDVYKRQLLLFTIFWSKYFPQWHFIFLINTWSITCWLQSHSGQGTEQIFPVWRLSLLVWVKHLIRRCMHFIFSNLHQQILLLKWGNLYTASENIFFFLPWVKAWLLTEYCLSLIHI